MTEANEEGDLAGSAASTGRTRRAVLKNGTGVAAAVLGAGLVDGLVDGTPARAEPAGLDGEDPALPELVLRKFVDPLPTPPVVRPRRNGRRSELTIRMRAVDRKLHADLPPTRLWTYGGHFPGPTIEVRRNERLWVNWINEIDEPMPLTAVEIADIDDVPGRPPGALPTNYPGRDGQEPLPNVAAAIPWLAVHLHGAHSGGGHDGWMENGLHAGQAQLSEYLNDQPGTSLWYHDHAMLMTRFTFLNGLFGMYLLRDEQESALGLPSGRREIPLIFCDRNLETTADGQPTGVLLHKILLGQVDPVPVVVPFAGPYSLVNGVIWPHLNVSPDWYRFRMLNASNGRVFQLYVLDDNDDPVPGALNVIGTDGGLLDAPVPVEGPLVLSPAERADVLVDFRAFAGRRLRLVNTRPGTKPGEPVPDDGIPEPDVMQFRVGRGRSAGSFVPPKRLSTSFERLRTETLPPIETERLIVLTSPGAPGNPEMWEMAEVDPDSVSVPSDGVIQLEDENGTLRTYERTAGRYADGGAFVMPTGSWEKWRFIDLGGPPHPMHVHAIQFQILNRDYYDITGWSMEHRGTTKPLTFTEPAAIQPHEQGWKDVVRVAAGTANRGRGEVVTIAGRFGDRTGRFVYHCHLLDHEHDMMRPFVIMPAEVLALQHGHHDGEHGG